MVCASRSGRLRVVRVSAPVEGFAQESIDPRPDRGGDLVDGEAHHRRDAQHVASEHHAQDVGADEGQARCGAVDVASSLDSGVTVSLRVTGTLAALPHNKSS